MDNLGWECSPVVTNVESSWSNQQHQIAERFIATDSNCSGFGTGVKIFIPIQRLHKIIDHEPSDHVDHSNSKKESQMVRHLVPPLDSIKVATTLNISQHQEATRLAANTMLAKSGPGTSWGEALSRPHMMVDPLSGLMANFGMPQDGNMAAAVSTTTASLESLDCLLSATNSNTDTSVEDDGINSILFSGHSKNLWNNFGSNNISSGDSGINNNSSRIKYHNQYCSRWMNEIDKSVPNSTTKRRNEGDSWNKGGGFQLISENPPQIVKKARLEKRPSSSNISFQQPSNSSISNACVEEQDSEAIAQMKEMIYRAAAFRPVNLGEEAVEKPKRKNVRISSDPQTVAARQRRERISEKIRVLQRMVPGGNKMDTASMLDEAANYLKFLRSQVKALEALGHKLDFVNCPISTPLKPNHPFPNSVIPFMIQPLNISHANHPFLPS